ncbi:nucleotidyl transferase AbiEii/AbiGii toxin family protein [Candidatus Amesbacteria bacterium]|nr:nucleotidyl transferase AbiEii/AbiGii toxin family protein [Candidatus Amesbacteria bacterium]
MITSLQIVPLVKKYKINEATIYREYLQLVFLNHLYSFPGSNNIFFKGGTAIHLLLKAPRFSEDLDFTVTLPIDEFEKHIDTVFKSLSIEENISFKPRVTKIGKRYLLTATLPVSGLKSFINLDFSFRENALDPQKMVLLTDFPVLITAPIPHLSGTEIFAEKIRAIVSRRKGRDIYDLWYLHTQGFVSNPEFIAKKLDYYQEKYDKALILERIRSFPQDIFINDLRPFICDPDRPKLGQLFSYILEYLAKVL